MLKGKVYGAQPLSGKAIPRGMDGISPVVGIEEIEGGYRVTITDISGTNVMDLMNGADGYTPVKGKDYFDGEDGEPGRDGYTPVKGVDYFDGEDGYTPVKGIDYFDGKQGNPGKDGYTPVRGKDYYTSADKEAIVADVLASLPEWSGGAY